jgi:hypothetical protein
MGVAEVAELAVRPAVTRHDARAHDQVTTAQRRQETNDAEVA